MYSFLFRVFLLIFFTNQINCNCSYMYVNSIPCYGPRAFLADLQKQWKPPEIEVVTVAYHIQFCHSSPLTGSFNCKTVLIIEMSLLLCLKCTFGKFQKSVIFG